MIEEEAGGIREGHRLKAVIPGGISSAMLTADEADVKMDFDSLKAAGTMGGSGGVMVMDETTCIVRMALVAARFFGQESCGQCSPCREGSGWLYRIFQRVYNGEGRPQDLDHLPDIIGNVGGNTICAFGDAVSLPGSATQNSTAITATKFEMVVKKIRFILF